MDYLTSEAVPRVLSTGQAFDIGGNHYGTEWLGLAAAADLAAAGIRTIVYVGSPGDPRYYSAVKGAPVINNGTATITWANTPLSITTVKASKLSDLNSYAIVRDGAGTTFGGFPIFTTDHFKILYAVANQRALAGSLTTLNLPDASGTFHALNAAQIESLYAAMATYMAAVLANQNVHQTAISALSDAVSVIAYDFTIGWPT